MYPNRRKGQAGPRKIKRMVWVVCRETHSSRSLNYAKSGSDLEQARVRTYSTPQSPPEPEYDAQRSKKRCPNATPWMVQTQ